MNLDPTQPPIFWTEITEYLDQHGHEITKANQPIAETKLAIDVIIAEINQQRNGPYHFDDYGPIVVWDIFIEFACGFDNPIISKEFRKKLKNIGMFLYYKFSLRRNNNYVT